MPDSKRKRKEDVITEERNEWGHIFPEDERCIIYEEEDGEDDGGEGKVRKRREDRQWGPDQGERPEGERPGREGETNRREGNP